MVYINLTSLKPDFLSPREEVDQEFLLIYRLAEKVAADAEDKNDKNKAEAMPVLKKVLQNVSHLLSTSVHPLDLFYYTKAFLPW